jgi:NAD(P)-dependent dehydrogenase (short-subunit alcohol dehydrogenase family)
MTDKVALVTGASRGFGRAMALALAEAGAHVCALGRTTGALEELDEQIQAAGGTATLIPLDIADDGGLARMGAALHGRWGRVDLWLHTAVYAPPLAPAELIGPKEFDSALSVNIRAFHRLIRVVDPLLRAAPAPVALIASDTVAGRKFHGLYGATKAAQSALTQSWAAEAVARITVAEVVPPPLPTAVRGRFHPGENTASLTRPEDAAARLMARLAEGIAPGAVVTL